MKQKNNVTIIGVPVKSTGGASGRFKITALKNGKAVRTTGWVKNQVVNTTNAGVQLLIQHMAGETANPIGINYLGIGTSEDARTPTMTDLVEPVLKEVIYADRRADGNEWQGDFYVLDSELPNDTYYEVGIYMGANLYATALIPDGFTKSDAEDLLISYSTTLTPA